MDKESLCCMSQATATLLIIVMFTFPAHTTAGVNVTGQIWLQHMQYDLVFIRHSPMVSEKNLLSQQVDHEIQ